MNKPFRPEDAARALALRWSAMWNGALPAAAVVAPSARVAFGRTPVLPLPATTTGPDELQAVIDGIRTRLPGIRYGFATPPLHQPLGGGGILTLLWEVAAEGMPERSGIDLLRHTAGEIVEVWSITGDLRLPPLPVA